VTLHCIRVTSPWLGCWKERSIAASSVYGSTLNVSLFGSEYEAEKWKARLGSDFGLIVPDSGVVRAVRSTRSTVIADSIAIFRFAVSASAVTVARYPSAHGSGPETATRAVTTPAMSRNVDSSDWFEGLGEL
jgi:hypothetical protein